MSPFAQIIGAAAEAIVAGDLAGRDRLLRMAADPLELAELALTRATIERDREIAIVAAQRRLEASRGEV